MIMNQKIQDDKRNIFTLKPRYLNIVKDDLKEMMEYKKGSTQYKSKTLKTADNIRLFSVSLYTLHDQKGHTTDYISSLFCKFLEVGQGIIFI